MCKSWHDIFLSWSKNNVIRSKENATKPPRTLARKAKHGVQNVRKKWNHYLIFLPRFGGFGGRNSWFCSNRVVSWFRVTVRERRQNRFGHNWRERGKLTQAGDGRLVAVTTTNSAQSVFPRQSRQTARFRTAQPDFVLERPQRIILDATNPDPWD